MQKTSFYAGRAWSGLTALLVVGWLLVGLKLPGLADDYGEKVVVDAIGNVYVTGRSWNGANSDYVTIKYSSSGAWLWGRRYNGPVNGDDVPLALVVDAVGNVYVTGYSSNGVNADYVTIKYSPGGNWLWGRRYNGPANNHDEAVALAVDGEGNVYITGHSSGLNDKEDYVTIKYDTNGNWLWGRRYNGASNQEDIPVGIAIDGQGSVFVTGNSLSSTTDYDYVTIKYDKDGNWIWGRRYNGIGNSEDATYAFSLDYQGNVYITGQSAGAYANLDYVTIKYNTNGNWLWGRRYNGIGNDWDCAKGLKVDKNSNVYVTGLSFGGTTTWYDYVTIKYDVWGNWVWGRRYSGPGDFWDAANALELDGNGNVYVTGESHSSGGAHDYVTIKYAQGGNWVWGRRYNGPDNDNDTAVDLAVDSGGNAIVTGWSNNGANDDYVTIKYSSGGAWVWGARYDGPD